VLIDHGYFDLGLETLNTKTFLTTRHLSKLHFVVEFTKILMMTY